MWRRDGLSGIHLPCGCSGVSRAFRLLLPLAAPRGFLRTSRTAVRRFPRRRRLRSRSGPTRCVGARSRGRGAIRCLSVRLCSSTMSMTSTSSVTGSIQYEVYVDYDVSMLGRPSGLGHFDAFGPSQDFRLALKSCPQVSCAFGGEFGGALIWAGFVGLTKEQQIQQDAAGMVVVIGAGSETRTRTLSPVLDFESSASTHSAIPAAERGATGEAATCARSIRSINSPAPARRRHGDVSRRGRRYRKHRLELGRNPAGAARRSDHGLLGPAPHPCARMSSFSLCYHFSPCASPTSTTSCPRN